MPTDKKFKDAVRARMKATGDGYMKAREHVLALHRAAASPPPALPTPEPKPPASNRWGYTLDMDIDTALFALHSDPDHDNLLWLREAGIEYDEEHADEPVTPAVAAWWGHREARSDGFRWLPGMHALDGFGESYRVVGVERGTPVVVTDTSAERCYLPMYAWLDLRDRETRRMAAEVLGRPMPDTSPVARWVCKSAKGWEQPKALPPMLLESGARRTAGPPRPSVTLTVKNGPRALPLGALAGSRPTLPVASIRKVEPLPSGGTAVYLKGGVRQPIPVQESVDEIRRLMFDADDL